MRPDLDRRRARCTKPAPPHGLCGVDRDLKNKGYLGRSIGDALAVGAKLVATATAPQSSCPSRDIAHLSVRGRHIAFDVTSLDAS